MQSHIVDVDVCVRAQSIQIYISYSVGWPFVHWISIQSLLGDAERVQSIVNIVFDENDWTKGENEKRQASSNCARSMYGKIDWIALTMIQPMDAHMYGISVVQFFKKKSFVCP